jgi:GNAT superfamily N-acetyltransferase
MKNNIKEKLSFRPVTEQDTEFLYKVYAGTREEELAAAGWDERQKQEFLLMQFNLQHTQYFRNYRDAAFEIILFDKVPAGRFYVDRREKEIRLIDLALLPEFRGLGIGTAILKDLAAEADEKNLPLNFHVERFNPARRLYERVGFKLKEDKGMHFFMEKEPAAPANNNN